MTRWRHISVKIGRCKSASDIEKNTKSIAAFAHKPGSTLSRMPWPQRRHAKSSATRQYPQLAAKILARTGHRQALMAAARDSPKLRSIASRKMPVSVTAENETSAAKTRQPPSRQTMTCASLLFQSARILRAYESCLPKHPTSSVIIAHQQNAAHPQRPATP